MLTEVTVEGPTGKKKFRRFFNVKWQSSRPWLMYEDGVMWCATCRVYPRPGMHKSWQTGNCHICYQTAKEHSDSGLHAVSVALWESSGTCAVGLWAPRTRIAFQSMHVPWFFVVLPLYVHGGDARKVYKPDEPGNRMLACANAMNHGASLDFSKKSVCNL